MVSFAAPNKSTEVLANNAETPAVLVMPHIYAKRLCQLPVDMRKQISVSKCQLSGQLLV